MKYTIYHHKHNRHGFTHVEHLCFICATKEAMKAHSGDEETIHPILVEEGRGQRTECSFCNAKLNWMDT